MYTTFFLVDCGIPSLGRDPNLQVEIFGSTIATSVAKYRCNTGYVLVGNSFSECLFNGSWSGPLPQCLKFRKLLLYGVITISLS